MTNSFFKKYFFYISTLLLGLIIATSLAGIDQAYRLQNANLYWYINKDQICLLVALGLLLSLLKKTRNALIIYGLMVFLMFIQLVHFSYFGDRITPAEITLFFTHSNEAVEDAPLLQIMLKPLIICIVATMITCLAFTLLKKRVRWRFAWILLIFAFLIPTIRIFYAYKIHRIEKGINDTVGDRSNSRDDLWYSTQKLLVFYFSYTLPHQLFFKAPLAQPVSPPLALTEKNPNVNVIFIQGESLTSKHMSFYGYFRHTTPYLDSLKNNPQVIFKRGISDGVCTDVSIPEIFNMIRRPDGIPQIMSTHSSLFKMAKINGFKTHFFSAQNENTLMFITQYLFPSFIDHFHIAANSKMMDDSLVQYVNSADLSKPTFLVVQMNGSHAPYARRFTEPFDLFKSSKHNNFKKEQVDRYDNSVIYTDHIVQEIVTSIKQKTNRPTYVIFTSDHGESLGETGHFGHNNLHRDEEHFVPIMIMGLNGAPLNFIREKDKEDINSNYMSHYELSRIVAKILGYQVKQLSEQHLGYYVNGVFLSGEAGFDHITFDSTGHPKDKLIYH